VAAIFDESSPVRRRINAATTSANNVTPISTVAIDATSGFMTVFANPNT